jgi:hypothetical protein
MVSDGGSHEAGGANMPVTPKVPLFVLEEYVTLITVLDEVGKAVDATWTGKEIAAEPVRERSDADLDTTAFKKLMREGETRTEDEIRADVRQQYEAETAPRRRRQAVVERCRGLLNAGLPSIALASDGRLYEVPAHIWAADGAEEIFDTGGILLVQGEEVTFRPGLRQRDGTATVLVKADDLNAVANRLTADEVVVKLTPTASESRHTVETDA